MKTFAPSIRCLATGCALLLGACMTGNDKNNAPATGSVDPATLGQSLNGGLSSMNTWQQSIANPASGVTLPSTGSSDLPSLARRSALGKASASSDTVITVDSSTQEHGYGTYAVTVKNQPGLLQTTFDTAVVVWDEKVHDTIQHNENVKRWSHTVVGPLETDRVEFTDADGDSLVNAVPGRDCRAKAVFIKTVGTTVESATVLVGPGPDGNFDTEADNITTQAEWKKTVNGELKADAKFLDDDSDGIVVDNGAVSPIRIELNEYAPIDQPWVESKNVVARIRNLGYGKGDMPVSFHYTETLNTGRVNEVRLQNSHGGEEITANDTMHAFITTTVATPTDTLASAKVEIIFNPGSDLKSDSDDVFYALNVETHKRLGWERDGEFHFTAGEPVPHGEQPKSGTVAAKVTYANDKSASLEGTFNADGYQVTYTGPDGNVLSVTYDKNGQVVSKP